MTFIIIRIDVTYFPIRADAVTVISMPAKQDKTIRPRVLKNPKKCMRKNEQWIDSMWTENNSSG